MRNHLLLLLCLFHFTASPQQKLLSMEEALVNARTTLAPENLQQVQFIYGTYDYVYLKKEGEHEEWVKGNSRSLETTFLNLPQLNEIFKSSSYGEIKSMPAIQFNLSPEWFMTLNGNKIGYNPISRQIREIIPKVFADKEKVEEGLGGYLAYLDKQDLYVARGEKDVRKITHDGSSDIVYASSVHREEFGISKGIFWSTKGKSLAFYRMDQSMVTDYPIIDWTTYPARIKNIRYPMAGGKSHQVTVGVYHAETKKLLYLKTGEPLEQYLTNIVWSPDDQFIYIAVLNRGQDHMKLNQYDAATGEFIKTILEERDNKYVEPLVPMLFLKNNPHQFIWQSNRDGWNHLYLYDDNGTLLKQLTNGPWEVIEVKAFNNKGDQLYYISTEVSPVTKTLYQLDLQKGTHKLVTPDIGVHQVSISTDGSSVIDSYSNTTDPRTVQLLDNRTTKTKLLLQAKNPLQDYITGEMKIFTLKNKSGDSLYCRMYMPAGFDSSKKYPVIVYWYGGPHAQMILNSWNGGPSDYWFQYLAERNFIVFTIDTRGSDNRGKTFEQSMFRHLGDVQMQDLMDGVDYLSSLASVDKNKMGLFGWSFGGFMTVDFMLNHPGVFKVAVAGGPVIDWKYYEVMYTERYMDTPQENPEGYAATDLTKKADKLSGKLMLIHGLQDPVVVQQHSVNFVRACVDKGVQVDYMIYPGHEHNVLGKDRAHLYQKVTNYFFQYLK